MTGIDLEAAMRSIERMPDSIDPDDALALVAALREARAEVERLRDDLSNAVRGLDAYVGANGASVAERDDWRRRYEALRDGVTAATEGVEDNEYATTIAALVRAVVARVEES